MRTIFCIFLMAVALTPRGHAYERIVSPDGSLEAYTTANFPNGSGMKLFLCKEGKQNSSVPVWSNNRWIDAAWSPDSRFLAVIDHPDGHIADVYVFGVTVAANRKKPLITLLYQTPSRRTYNVQWSVIGWMLKQRAVVLKKQMRDISTGVSTEEEITARIGRDSLRTR